MTFYLHPDHTAVEAREAAHDELTAAINRLREVADSLEAFVAHDVAKMDEHGNEYASSESIKATLINRVTDANRDLGRAQQDLFGAVSAAARA